MNQELEQRLNKCTTLPTLSAVAIEVLQRCRDEDLDFQAIGQIIGRDPALTVKVLKMANCPLFGLRQEVRTIPQALNVLGLNSMRALVLSFSLVRDCAQERHGPVAECWKRSVISSIAARELCALKSPDLKEEAYLAGLLQDIGIMAMAKAFGDQYAQLHQQELPHEGLCAAEEAVFGADHGEVGAWLLARWGVPEHLAQLARASHDWRKYESGDERMQLLARCVQYSGRLADLWSSVEPEAAVHLAESDAAILFGEGALDIPQLGEKILTSVKAVAPLFEVELDNDEMASVLEQAQEVMQSSVLRMEAATESLRVESQRDALTGLFNRASLDAHLRNRFEAPHRGRIGVLFADVDHFKTVNDQFGHAAGDAVLRSVAQRIASCARACDFVARYGGEEFVIVVDVKEPAETAIVAERIRAAVAHPDHSMGDGLETALTISIGAATADPGKHAHAGDLLKEADENLYKAKRSGRNQVVGANDTAAHFEPVGAGVH